MTEASTIDLSENDGAISVYMDPYSARIRVDDYDGSPEAVLRLIGRAVKPWVEKIILKSSWEDRGFFLKAGYREEATVSGYFNGNDMSFLVQYPAAARRNSGDQESETATILELVKKAGAGRIPDPSIVSPAGLSDAEELAYLFRRVFQIYPTPVGDPSYILKTMQEGTMYYVVREEGKVVSAGSAELNSKHSNAELTDCSTLTEAAGKGYMVSIMAQIDRELVRRGIRCRYSIARAVSYPVNVVFHRLGFSFTGTLHKNVRIGTGLEDMNVWSRFDP